jgi:four helix bundle protein
MVHGAWCMVHGARASIVPMPFGMKVSQFTDLECWQLSESLKLRVYEIADRPAARKDFDFRTQIRKSGRSAPRNIAEGFGRFTHPEIAQFLKVALGSLHETRDALIDAKDSGYITSREYEELQKLTTSAIKCTKAFKRSVSTRPTPKFW